MGTISYNQLTSVKSGCNQLRTVASKYDKQALELGDISNYATSDNLSVDGETMYDEIVYISEEVTSLANSINTIADNIELSATNLYLEGLKEKE